MLPAQNPNQIKDTLLSFNIGLVIANKELGDKYCRGIVKKTELLEAIPNKDTIRELIKNKLLADFTTTEVSVNPYNLPESVIQASSNGDYKDVSPFFKLYVRRKFLNPKDFNLDKEFDKEAFERLETVINRWDPAYQRDFAQVAEKTGNVLSAHQDSQWRDSADSAMAVATKSKNIPKLCNQVLEILERIPSGEIWTITKLINEINRINKKKAGGVTEIGIRYAFSIIDRDPQLKKRFKKVEVKLNIEREPVITFVQARSKKLFKFLNELPEGKKMTIKELAKQLKVSEGEVRNDLRSNQFQNPQVKAKLSIGQENTKGFKEENFILVATPNTHLLPQFLTLRKDYKVLFAEGPNQIKNALQSSAISLVIAGEDFPRGYYNGIVRQSELDEAIPNKDTIRELIKNKILVNFTSAGVRVNPYNLQEEVIEKSANGDYERVRRFLKLHSKRNFINIYNFLNKDGVERLKNVINRQPVYYQRDSAQITDATTFNKGGIDLTPANMNLQVKKEIGPSEGIKLP